MQVQPLFLAATVTRMDENYSLEKECQRAPNLEASSLIGILKKRQASLSITVKVKVGMQKDAFYRAKFLLSVSCAIVLSWRRKAEPSNKSHRRSSGMWGARNSQLLIR